MSKICRKCNTVLDDSAKFCHCCGMPIDNDPDMKTDDDEITVQLNDDDVSVPYEQDQPDISAETEESIPEDVPENNPFQQSFEQPESYTSDAPGSSNDVLGRKEFFEKYVSKKAKGYATVLAVIALISGALSIPSLIFGNLLSIMDIAFYIVMGILILTTKNWIFTLIVTIYSSIFSIITIAISGTPTGIVVLIVGIFATMNLKKVNDAYKQYLLSGILPTDPIE